MPGERVGEASLCRWSRAAQSCAGLAAPDHDRLGRWRDWLCRRLDHQWWCRRPPRQDMSNRWLGSWGCGCDVLRQGGRDWLGAKAFGPGFRMGMSQIGAGICLPWSGVAGPEMNHLHHTTLAGAHTAAPRRPDDKPRFSGRSVGLPFARMGEKMISVAHRVHDILTPEV